VAHPDAQDSSDTFPWMKSVRALTAQLDDLVRETVGLALPPVDEALAEAGPAALALGDYCRRCGDSIGEGEATTGGCVTCRKLPALADRVVRLGTYDGPLRELILAIKFQKWWEMGRTLGRMLGDRVAADAQIESGKAVVVPVPMPWQRRLFRGIDHARVIASGVAQAMEAPLLPVLAKSNGAPQLALTPSMRVKLGGRGLKIRPRLGGWPIAGCDVVLVDDVRTTGATLRRAVRLLRRMQSRSVTAAVVAVADHSSRRRRSDQSRPELSVSEGV
jgi:predicted amidophosphoribosyltransferase